MDSYKTQAFTFYASTSLLPDCSHLFTVFRTFQVVLSITVLFDFEGTMLLLDLHKRARS